MPAGNPSHEGLCEAYRKLPSDWEPVPCGPHCTLRLHACPVHAELTQRPGGYQYIIKTDKLVEELKLTVKRALEELALREDNVRLRREPI